MNYPDELIFLKNRNAIQKHSDFKITGKTVVLTGATSGIGRQTALRLAKDDIDLSIIIRDLEKGMLLKKEIESNTETKVQVLLADFSNLNSIKKLAKDMTSQLKKIDILIHNAGIHSTKRFTTVDGFEQTFQINYLASYLLSQLLLPLLQKSQNAIILYVNSEGHRFSDVDLDDVNFEKHHYTGLKAYGASKTAQLLSILVLQKYEAFKGISLIAMHPGDVKSNIGQNNGLIYRIFSKFFIQPFLRDPNTSAEAIHCLVSDPVYRENLKQFYHLTIEEPTAKHACNFEKAQKLIEITNEFINNRIT